MAEGRILKRNISDSKKLGDLNSDSARLLYTWLIPWTDCEGRYTGDPDLIKGRIFPKVKSWTPIKIERNLIELHEIELIDLYEVNGEWHLQFRKTLQRINKSRERESDIPPPPDQLRSPPESSGVLRGKLNQSKLKQIKLNKEKGGRSCEDPKCRDLDHWECQFSQYWEAFPKSMGRTDTHSLFMSICRKGEIEELIKGLDGYIEYLSDQKINENFDQAPMNSARFLRKDNWREFIGFKMRKKL